MTTVEWSEPHMTSVVWSEPHMTTEVWSEPHMTTVVWSEPHMTTVVWSVSATHDVISSSCIAQPTTTFVTSARQSNTPSGHLKELQLVLDRDPNTQVIAYRASASVSSLAPPLRHEYSTRYSLHDLQGPPWWNTLLCVLNAEALHSKQAAELRSSDQGLLVLPKYNIKKYGAKSFSVAAPTICNSLPAELRLCNNNLRFKSLLKTFLFKRFYNV